MQKTRKLKKDKTTARCIKQALGSLVQICGATAN